MGQEPFKPILAASSRLHTELFRGTTVLAVREYFASGMELKPPPDRHAAIFSDSKTISTLGWKVTVIDAAVYSNVLEFNLDLAGEINIIIPKETLDYETSFPEWI